jgi:hypothetical protein
MYYHPYTARLLRRKHNGRILALLGGTTGMADFVLRLIPVPIDGTNATIGAWHSLCGSWVAETFATSQSIADCGNIGDAVTLLTLGLWLAAALIAAGLWLLLAPARANEPGCEF